MQRRLFGTDRDAGPILAGSVHEDLQGAKRQPHGTLDSAGLVADGFPSPDTPPGLTAPLVKPRFQLHLDQALHEAGK